jgi:TAP-like protein
MNNSRIAGDMAVHFITQCAQWQMDAKERYEGDFQVQTVNPILLLQNTSDPVTPLRSAHNMSAGLEGSVVLEQNGYGVSPLFSRSPPPR